MVLGDFGDCVDIAIVGLASEVQIPEDGGLQLAVEEGENLGLLVEKLELGY